MYLDEYEYQKVIKLFKLEVVLNKKRLDIYYNNIGIFRFYIGDNYISVVIKR